MLSDLAYLGKSPLHNVVAGREYEPGNLLINNVAFLKVF